jgi:hypothetical protein
MIESTPICGVEIIKATVAPREAPSFLNDIAVGMTPQEHKGNGIPINPANKTDLKFSLAKCRSKKFDGTKTCNTPAIKNPNKRYGAIWHNIFIKVNRAFVNS